MSPCIMQPPRARVAPATTSTVLAERKDVALGRCVHTEIEVAVYQARHLSALTALLIPDMGASAKCDDLLVAG